MNLTDDRGSTVPLILGFFILALLMVAGAVAAGQAFVQQRDLQDVCDSAAAAGAASAASIDRGSALVGVALRFTNVQAVVDQYLARDPSLAGVRIQADVSVDAQTLQLQCTQTLPIAFGAMFGKAHGIRHLAISYARAPVS
ncbi:MAG: pilus assembly protein TadG-related protein [Actinomycetota bacterium]|nr:pilus assembly protein TadG-related protein [Actinomycetota bacterium]